MARRNSYSFERNQRAKAKAAKQEAKREAKAAARAEKRGDTLGLEEPDAESSEMPQTDSLGPSSEQAP